MKMHSQVEYKQEVSGIVRQQPYHLPQQQQPQQQQPQQQRRIRVLEPVKPLHRGSPSGSSSGGAAMPQFGGRRYHVNLKGVREIVLETNEVGLLWGVRHQVPDDDGEFKLRLLQRPSRETYQLQDQQQDQQRLKCVEISRESFELLCFHEPKIRSLMLAHDKAIIFQNMDVQVYVMEEVKKEGFRIHFQDKQQVKVSLTYQTFRSFMSAVHRINVDYAKYKKKLKIKKNKLKLKLLNRQIKCE